MSLRELFPALIPYTRKEKRLKINELSTQHKKLGKDQQNRHKESRSNKDKSRN